MGSLDTRRVQLTVLTLIGVAALVAAVLLATGVVGNAGTLRVPSGVAESASNGRVTGDRPQADNVEEFTKKYGEPPDATFGRMRIPAISVDAPLTYRLVTGQMPDPSGPSDIAYYDMSRYPGLGGVPGRGGNAIFGGHVDLNRPIPYANGAHYQGPAVLWSLDALHPGHTIEIDVSGKTYKYRVISTDELPADYADWAAIWKANPAKETITLFTCGGAFDPDTHEYTRRRVVRAERF
jgi:sortase (surface protein transpeptidase)